MASQHSTLSRWAVSVESFVSPIQLFLSLPRPDSLPEKAFVVSYILLDQTDTVISAKLDNIPVASANLIKGRNFNYIDRNTRQFLGMLKLPEFIAPKATDRIIIEMRRWEIGDQDPGIPELLSVVEMPEYDNLLMKRVSKISVSDGITENVGTIYA